MHKFARASLVASCLALGVTLTACSDDSGAEKEQVDLSESGNSSPSADSSADGSGTDQGSTDALATDYPDVGLEFTSLPEVKGAKRAALETYVDFEQGQRKLSRTAELNSMITDNAAPSVEDSMQATIDWLNQNKTRYDGTARIDVSFEGMSAGTAVLDLCIDAKGLSLVTDGQKRPVEGRERGRSQVSVTNAGGAWQVTNYSDLDESC